MTATVQTKKEITKDAFAIAKLSDYRQSSRKVRLVADSIRGKSVPKALTLLDFTIKKAADPIKKLLESAISNAKEKGLNPDEMIISEIRVDEGPTLKRHRARARGRAGRIDKRTSSISIKISNK